MHRRRIDEFAGVLASQLLALQVIRRALAEPAVEGAAWRDAGDALRLAQSRMLSLQDAGLIIAREDSTGRTRHERRLLRAIAAAQRPDPALTDNYLFSLAPGRTLRPILTDAIEHLAAGLARHGHHLPLTHTFKEPSLVR